MRATRRSTRKRKNEEASSGAGVLVHTTTTPPDAAYETPSPLAAASVAAGQFMSLKRKKAMFTEVDCSKSILENLPADVIGLIFFSGFFNSVDICKKLVYVCKDFNQISKSTVRAADMRCVRSITSEKLRNVLKNTFHNICFLDLSYCAVYDHNLNTISTSPVAQSLKGLSLRGSQVTNEGLHFIAAMPNLQYLDISKTTSFQKELIDDISPLSTLRKLELVNVAMTDITDDSLVQCLDSWHQLKYLSVQCCMLGFQCFVSMSQRHLIALDISGTYIGGPEINALLKNGSPCRLSLETLACSHLPLIGSSLSYILDHAVNLKQLDMRGVMKTEDQRIRKDVARGVFELAIFEPHEQLGFGDKATFRGVDYYFGCGYNESR